MPPSEYWDSTHETVRDILCICPSVINNTLSQSDPFPYDSVQPSSYQLVQIKTQQVDTLPLDQTDENPQATSRYRTHAALLPGHMKSMATTLDNNFLPVLAVVGHYGPYQAYSILTSLESKILPF